MNFYNIYVNSLHTITTSAVIIPFYQFYIERISQRDG